jgi:uncharacterized membrane protein YdfJ with MMPL/SSD domain
VFLLTRIKEAHDQGASNRAAVATGLQHTGRVVTAGALMIAVALGAFGTSHVIFLKELGLGTAAAVLIDAFIIRACSCPPSWPSWRTGTGGRHQSCAGSTTA